jgi:hypothetical protein
MAGGEAGLAFGFRMDQASLVQPQAALGVLELYSQAAGGSWAGVCLEIIHELLIDKTGMGCRILHIPKLALEKIKERARFSFEELPIRR